MSSNKISHWGSLKSRLTVFYVGMFMITQLLCVTVIYFAQQQSVSSDARKKVHVFTREFTYEYMTGAEFSVNQEQISLDRMDQKILRKIHESEPNFVFEMATIDSMGDTTVLGSAGDIVCEFTALNGQPAKVSRKTYEVEDRIALMHDEFNEESYGEDVNEVYFLLLSPEGDCLAKSGFNAVGVDHFTTFRLPEDTTRENMRLAHEDGAIFASYHRLFDGNVLVIGKHMKQFNKYIVNLLYSILLTLVLSLVVSFYSGRFIAGRFVSGILRVTRAARKIESGNYAERVSHGTEGTEINDLADAFNDMTTNTEKLLIELKMISDSMAHDLRTPITRMRGQAEMSLNSPKDNELASDVAEECENMLTLINTMLEITQTEFNISKIEKGKLDFAAIARTTVDLLATVADDKGVTLRVDIPEIPLMMFGNKVQLQRLIGNLLDNAIKFTPANGVVSLSMRSDSDSVLLTVADTGCGIPEADSQHVFERFYRSDSSRNVPGNGLGLSLVKAIVDSYDGSIVFKSEIGRGTVFTLTLPVDADPRLK